MNMRFFANGINIPDELLWAQDEGRVVFFCGAGVSQAYAGLPDFKLLTQNVLDRLGAQSDNPARRLFEAANAIEDDYGISDLAASDRVFTELLNHFDQSTMDREVAAALTPGPDASLRAHKAMVKLATAADGSTSLITTNFDRLFEKSKPKLKCVTRTTIPNIEFQRQDWGVIHLHGVLKPDYSAPTKDGLILSSADFGGAYLASGWARSFVQDVLNKFTAVFVGYSANDPPIRYLLEGMKISGLADQKAYAFQVSGDDKAISQWDDKGVEAITFDNDDGEGYERLWGSLEEWGQRSSNPTKWRKDVITKASKGPQALQPHERGMVAHVVSSTQGSRAIALGPKPIPAEWLCVFDRQLRYGEPGRENGLFEEGPTIDPFEVYRLDTDPEPLSDESKRNLHTRFDKTAWDGLNPSIDDLRELPANRVAHLGGMNAQNAPALPERLSNLAHWVTKVAHQPAAPWWASQKGSLHPQILEYITLSSRQNGKKMPTLIADAWRRIALVNQQHPLTRREAFELKLSLKQGQHNEMLAREYARCFSPYLKFQSLWRRPLPPQTIAACKRQPLAGIEVVYDEHIKSIEIPDAYVGTLVPKLRYALLTAVDYQHLFRPLAPKLASIEKEETKPDRRDSSFQRHYKFSGHVLLFVELIRRLAKLDPNGLRDEIRTWPRTNRPFERLRVWAFGNIEIFSASEFFEELKALDRERFWPSDGQRDLMLGLVRHWTDFSTKQRKALERRILLGPRTYNHLSKIQNAEMKAHYTLNRIHWLVNQGCEMSFDVDAVTEKLKKETPDWSPENADRAARTFDGGGGFVRTDNNTDTLSGLKPDEIIPEILKMDARPVGLLVHYEPFAGLSQEDPKRALQALQHSETDEVFHGAFWNSFLNVEARDEDDQALADEIAVNLCGLANHSIAQIRHASSRWFEKTGQRLSASVFNALWDKFIAVLEAFPEAGESGLVRQEESPRWIDEAINSTSGHLTELLMSTLRDGTFDAGELFSNQWKKRANQLLNLTGDTRRFVLACFGQRLNFLHHVDPRWVSKQLLPLLLNEDVDLQDKDALWSGFLSSGRAPGNELLRILIYKVVELPQKLKGVRRHHSEMMAVIFLVSWAFRKSKENKPLLSSNQLKSIILKSDAELRSQMLWLVESWSKDEGIEHDIALPFVREVWPKQKTVRTAQMSARLCELALSRTDDFPEFVDAVLPLISRVEDDQVFIPELRRDEKHQADEHPEAFLKLLHGVLGENPNRWPYGADAVVRRIADQQPHLKRNPMLEDLLRRLN